MPPGTLAVLTTLPASLTVVVVAAVAEAGALAMKLIERVTTSVTVATTLA